MSMGYALARAELIRALTAYSGITTSDGLADGTTVVDITLIGRNDFISEKAVLIMSGDAQYEDKGAASFNNVTGTITLQGTGFSAQIKAGTIYRILNISSVEIDVATINTKIGTNVDPAGTTTIFAWLLKLFEQGGQGLVYYGNVTAVDLATQFRVAGLAGFGDAYFANTYRVYVVRDAAGLGAAPQTQMRPCTAYTSIGGIFTHPAFTVGLAVGDEVLLIHERIAEIADIIVLLHLSAPSATFVYLDAGGEQVVFTYTPTENAIVQTIWLDLTTLTQNNTIRVKIGGITTETFNWTTGMDNGVYFRQIALPAGVALQITMQETANEGADRNIPYYYVYEER